MIHIQLLTNIQRQHQAKNDHKEVNFSKTNTNKIQFTRQFTYQLMRGFSKNVTVQNKSISIFPPPSPGVCSTYLLTPPPSICSIYLLPPPSVLLIKTALKYHIQVLNYLFVCLSILLGDQRHFKTRCLDQKNTMLSQKGINCAVSN